MSLEEQFAEASEHFKGIVEQSPDKTKLKMYALFNQATKGDVKGNAPSRMDVRNHAKFMARKKCFGMPADVAMRRYIAEVRSIDPSFVLSSSKEAPSGKKTAELAKDFQRAAAFVKSKGAEGIANAQWFLLYGYFKQATEGVCKRPKPGVFASSDKNARWKAWANLFDMSKEEAMQKYIDLTLKAYSDSGLDFASASIRNQSSLFSPNFEENEEDLRKEDKEMSEMMIVDGKTLQKRLSEAKKTKSDVVFVTGGTGFIGKHFLDVLLNSEHHLGRNGNEVGSFGRYLDRLERNTKSSGGLQGEKPLVVILSRESSVEKACFQILKRNGKNAADKVVVLPFSLSKKFLGVKSDVKKVLQKADFASQNADSVSSNRREAVRLFHFAASYSLTADEETNNKANVDGTLNVVEFCGKLGVKLEYISSVAVAGDYDGMFLETSFDEGQDFKDNYSRSKFEAEKLVRKEMEKGLKCTIFRPGVVVGHSVTGEAEKRDGPYYFFPWLQLLRSWLPTSLPIPMLDGETVPIVPVDYVAKAIFHISLNRAAEQTEGRCFHVTDSSAAHSPEGFIESINLFAKAAGAPLFSGSATTLLLALIPRSLSAKILDVPILRDTPKWFAKNVLGVPNEAMEYLQNRTSYDDSDAQLLLSNSGIKCPSLRDYADKLWDFYERKLDLINIDKDAALAKEISGKNVVVTGGTDGIGLELSHRLAKTGANVLIVARNQEKLNKCVKDIESSAIAAVGKEGVGKISGYKADLSEGKATDLMINKVLKENGFVDILINNAGRSIRRSVEYEWKDTGRFHDFERTMALNYFGALRCILGFLPVMRERKSGQIINISSIGVAANQARFGAYAASKSALDGFSRCVAAECAHDNVHLSTVYMPLVQTKMIQSKSNNYTERYGSYVLTPEQACDLIVDAIVTRQRTVAVPWTRAVMVAYQAFPSVVETVNNMIYRLEPEEPPKGVEASADASGDREQIKAILNLFKS